MLLPQPRGGGKILSGRPTKPGRIDVRPMARPVADRNGASIVQGTGRDVPELQFGN